MNFLLPSYSLKKIKFGCSVTTSYVSLINPFLLSNYSFENYRRLSYLKPNDKVYVKQSYMILTWFYYLTFVDTLNNNNKKNINMYNKFALKFYAAPKINKKFTITKAPIAHKTRSKEQILFTFFKFNMLFRLHNASSLSFFFFYTSCDQTLLSILLTKNTISFAETNLLFLKRKKIQIKFIDPKYFTYKF